MLKRLFSTKLTDISRSSLVIEKTNAPKSKPNNKDLVFGHTFTGNNTAT